MRWPDSGQHTIVFLRTKELTKLARYIFEKRNGKSDGSGDISFQVPSEQTPSKNHLRPLHN